MGRPSDDDEADALERGGARASEAPTDAPPPSYRTQRTNDTHVQKNDAPDAHMCFVISSVVFAILLGLAIGLGVALTHRADAKSSSSDTSAPHAHT